MLRSLVPRKERSLFPTSERFSQLMSRWEEEMEDLKERFFGGDGAWMVSPDVDLVETDSQYEVAVDLPGLKPEEVTVELKNGDLWISGNHEEEKEEKGKTFHRVERHHGEFRRVLPLPGAINEEKVAAKFEHGVLRVTVPKTEKSKPKHIEVKA